MRYPLTESWSPHILEFRHTLTLKAYGNMIIINYIQNMEWSCFQIFSILCSTESVVDLFRNDGWRQWRSSMHEIMFSRAYSKRLASCVGVKRLETCHISKSDVNSTSVYISIKGAIWVCLRMCWNIWTVAIECDLYTYDSTKRSKNTQHKRKVCGFHGNAYLVNLQFWVSFLRDQPRGIDSSF
jgi:hypothetical protein